MASEQDAAQRALENVARRREELMELGREISSIPGWTAWWEAPGVLRLEYANWPPDVRPLDPIYAENRGQWEAWRKVVEEYKPAPERIKELEQQLDQAREDKQLYFVSWLSICKERDQARALLEEARPFVILFRDDYALEKPGLHAFAVAWIRKSGAFLAPKEQTDG